MRVARGRTKDWRACASAPAGRARVGVPLRQSCGWSLEAGRFQLRAFSFRPETRSDMRIICRVLVSCAVILLPASVQATVLVPARRGELAREAGAIVRGRVIAAETRFTPDRRAIETLVTLDAE